MQTDCVRCKRHQTQLEEHHLWPKFMDNPHGYTFESYPNRVTLCLTCHKALHREVIRKILNQFTNTLDDGSLYQDYYLWKSILAIDKINLSKKIIEESYKFIFDKEFENGL